MQEEKHIIKKAVVELYLPSSKNSFDIQNKTLRYFKECIVPLIEKIVGRLSTDERIIRIDKLEFDLKNFNYDTPDEAALMKLEQKLEEDLIRFIRDEADLPPELAAKVTKLKETERDEELFMYLLMNGNLPWWAASGSSVSLEEIAEIVIEKAEVSFREELRNTLSSPAVRKRIAFQLPASLVEKIIDFSCEDAPGLISIVNSLSGFLQESIPASYKLKSVFYKHALRYSQHKNVNLPEYAGTLIREEFDSMFAEKLYQVCRKKEDTFASGMLYPEYEKLHQQKAENDPAKISFILKKALAENDAYFNGRIEKLFDLNDAGLFFRKETNKIKKQSGNEATEKKIPGKKKIEDDSDHTLISPGNDESKQNTGKEKDQPEKKNIKKDTEKREHKPKEKLQKDDENAEAEQTGTKRNNRSDVEKEKEALRSGSEKKNESLKITGNEYNTEAEKKNTTEKNRRLKGKNETGKIEKRPEYDYEEGNPLNLYVNKEATELFVNNAGVIIITPFLPTLFKALELYDGKKFVSTDAQERAVCLLQYISSGNAENMQEHEMVLSKVICGLDADEPVVLQSELSEREIEECNGLLEAAAGNWQALKGTSGAGMREAFFTREGILEKHVNGWNLKIERITIDILLDRLPWGISIVKMPWSEEMIFTSW
jgi:hypothetical protein